MSGMRSAFSRRKEQKRHVTIDKGLVQCAMRMVKCAQMYKCTSATDSLQLDELELIVCDELSDEMAAVELSCCSLFPEHLVP